MGKNIIKKNRLLKDALLFSTLTENSRICKPFRKSSQLVNWVKKNPKKYVNGELKLPNKYNCLYTCAKKLAKENHEIGKNRKRTTTKDFINLIGSKYRRMGLGLTKEEKNAI
jgi:hypothetical protein